MRDIAIYGFGGFGREIACLIAEINKAEATWNLIGYFDDGVPVGTENRYGKVLGNIDTLNSWDTEMAIVLAIGNGKIVKQIVGRITNPNVDFPNIIAPNVSFFDRKTVELGRGNIVTFGCRISCDVRLGNFNILNGCVSLGHDVKINDYNVLFPDTRISGETTVGDLNFFGARAFVAQGLKIGHETKISAGSVVLRNTKDGSLYMGNPALKIKI